MELTPGTEHARDSSSSSRSTRRLPTTRETNSNIGDDDDSFDSAEGSGGNNNDNDNDGSDPIGPFVVDGEDYQALYFWNCPPPVRSRDLRALRTEHLAAAAKTVHRHGGWRQPAPPPPRSYLAHKLVLDAWGDGCKGQLGNHRMVNQTAPVPVKLSQRALEDCVDLADTALPAKLPRPWHRGGTGRDLAAIASGEQRVAPSACAGSGNSAKPRAGLPLPAPTSAGDLLPRHACCAGVSHSLWVIGGRIYRCGEGKSELAPVPGLERYRIEAVFSGGRAAFALGGRPDPALLAREKYLRQVVDRLQVLSPEQPKNGQNSAGSGDESSDDAAKDDEDEDEAAAGQGAADAVDLASTKDKQQQRRPRTVGVPVSYLDEVTRCAIEALASVTEEVARQREGDGRVWSWGYNECEVLGHGKLYKYVQGETRSDGREIKRPTGKKIRPFRGVHALNRRSSTEHNKTKDPAIFADEVAVAKKKAMYSMFVAEDIEDDDVDDFEEVSRVLEPRSIPRFYFGFRRLRQIACGTQHALALNDLGRVFAWGHGRHGRLGLGEDTTSCERPALLRFRGRRKIAFVAAGALHSCAVGRDGSAFTWGDNSFGQLGRGKIGRHEFTPGIVKFFSNGGDGRDRAIRADRHFAVPRSSSTNGGDDEDSEEEDIEEDDLLVRVATAALGSEHSTFLCCRRERPLPRTKRSCVVRAVFACGNNRFGQLGVAALLSAEAQLQPVRVEEEIGFKEIVTVKAGNRHVVAVDVEGKTWTWGYNFYGQLGLGHRRPCIAPTPVLRPEIVYPPSAGGPDVVARRKAGFVVSRAEDGDRPQVDLWEPQPAARHTAVAVACGAHFTLRASYVRFRDGAAQRGSRVEAQMKSSATLSGPPVVHCCRNSGPEPVPTRLFYYVTALKPLDGRAVGDFAAALDIETRRLAPDLGKSFLPGIMCSRCLRYLAPLNPVVQHVWRNAGRQFCCFGNRAGCPRLLPCPETPAGANAQDAVPASKSPITAPAKHEGSITTRPGWIADLDEASGQWYEMSEATGESRWLDNPPPGAGPMSVTEADAEHDGRKRTTVPSLARPALAESAHAKKLLLGSEARAFWIEFAAKQTRMLEAQKKANALEAAATAGLNEVEEEDESVAGSFDDEIHSIKNVPMHTRRRPGATAAMGGSAGRHQRGSSRRSQRKGAGGKMSSPSEAHTAKHSADESVQHNDLEPW